MYTQIRTFQVTWCSWEHIWKWSLQRNWTVDIPDYWRRYSQWSGFSFDTIQLNRRLSLPENLPLPLPSPMPAPLAILKTVFGRFLWSSVSFYMSPGDWVTPLPQSLCVSSFQSVLTTDYIFIAQWSLFSLQHCPQLEVSAIFKDYLCPYF